nr:hypothetical protein [Tanacetum cinerariifolium]
ADRGAVEQRRLCDCPQLRRQAVREDGRALFPDQGPAAQAGHRGLQQQLRPVWPDQRAGDGHHRIDGAGPGGVLDRRSLCLADG